MAPSAMALQEAGVWLASPAFGRVSAADRCGRGAAARDVLDFLTRIEHDVYS
jgi:hypothetical protein